MSRLKYLTDEMLIIAYHEALSLNLETDFVMLLVSEIKKRGIKDIEV